MIRYNLTFQIALHYGIIAGPNIRIPEVIIEHKVNGDDMSIQVRKPGSK